MLAAYRHVLTFLFLINLFYADVYCMPRTTQNIALPSSTIGTRQYLIVHNYAPDYKQATKKAYIQASLHADELPGNTQYVEIIVVSELLLILINIHNGLIDFSIPKILLINLKLF